MSLSAFAGRGESWVYGDADETRVTRSTRVITLSALLLLSLFAWSIFARLDEVSTGSGRVVPISREQVVQSLDGGILAVLHVGEDDVVAPGQLLAQLDPTRTGANVEESAARYRAALASAARLQAEVNRSELIFPAELAAFPELQVSERELFEARRSSLIETQRWVAESLDLVRQELAISEQLTNVGAASNVEVLRLRRQAAELEQQQVDTRSEYVVQAREELAKANAEVAALSSVIKGRTDSLSRLTFYSPVRGIVKDIEISTIGGVIAPNGRLMTIVPLGDKLLVETRISPRDIAFIQPGQRATVKLTAYDYSIYGGLEGQVTTVSPDTIQDQAQPELFYYRVFIETKAGQLVNSAGASFPIVPGMVATVDIHTGSKTVFDYLAKPLNRAAEALRER
ncbi:MAG TPA: HlyD family efflux transporter periplasmic adaptor subunit [Devosia sp.]|jgi:adhesin transport system membrane fusion protein|uniref:HlyD family efflux transporter periplasmic adaptor subunit n=1 Tax=Devosia sp. TaxID=1871048 RepID=UPI002DDD52AC|nr:HlyD family efflux transporter periplasmic adaptor subunit [Devosia sp.]HEV2516411.1 HlyD family efflux transporter periplasmic adaptor subunit [Devosia sp.]